MLTPSVLQGLRTRVNDTRGRPAVQLLHEDPASEDDGLRYPVTVLATTARDVASDPTLVEEHFGPVSLVVRYTDGEELAAALRKIDGTLTFTVQAAEDEADSLRDIIELMSERAGRIIWNGYPTGVAVVPAMHHGGPYPATTSPLHTSVGTTAVRRFQRPVAYQGTPATLLPPALRENNPLHIPRRVDGILEASP
jgi:NADP-dependent aldehyde dehydrogenase